MSWQLLPCPACARHLKSFEPACPFCAADTPPSFATLPAPNLPPRTVGRAAIMAYRSLGAAAVVAGAFAGCDDNGGDIYGGPPVEMGTRDADPRDTGPVAIDAAYGAPPMEAGPLDLGPPMVDAAYGAPPPDAARLEDGAVSQLYGAVPPDDGG